MSAVPPPLRPPVSLSLRLSVSPSLCLSIPLSLRLSIPLSLVLFCNVVVAQTDAPPGRWKLETLTLEGGKQYRGVVQEESKESIEFAEIIQPAGKPMHAVIRGVPRSLVQKLQRLDEAAHQELVARFAQFRHRAVIEAGRLEAVQLRSENRDGTSVLVYAGPWFTLTSTADDEQTRRCVVRIEQLFRAYRTLLPPRSGPSPPLAVMLYGSLDDYRQRLRLLHLSLDNAAFYSPRERTILAGSDLNLFAQRLAQVRREHEQVRQTYAKLDSQFPETMVSLNADLRAAGFSEADAAAEIRQRRATWKAQMEEALAANAERQRTNERKFGEVTGQMFTRLGHEAFHAYLDTFVYPSSPLGDKHVPRWLNEGLAQVFETGQLDGDSLRIDAPDRGRLKRLREDMSQQPLPLAQLLTAEEREFLGPHDAAASQRHYLYAWGLAWHLTFQENLLGSPRLDEYVAAALPDDRLARFEKLVGRPLAEFENEWRTAR